MACPAVDYKAEGAHAQAWRLGGIELGADMFFDGGHFDPAHPVDYLAGFATHNMAVDGERLAAANPPLPAAPGGAAADTRT